MARPTGSCPPGRKPLLSDRETALGRRSFRPSPCRGRHPSSPRRRGGSNIHSYFWPMWLKYSFPLVAQILVPTWLKYSLTFTDVAVSLSEDERQHNMNHLFYLFVHSNGTISTQSHKKESPSWLSFANSGSPSSSALSNSLRFFRMVCIILPNRENQINAEGILCRHDRNHSCVFLRQ